MDLVPINDFLMSLKDYGSLIDHVAGDVSIGVAFLGLLFSLVLCFFGYRLFLLWLFIIGAIIGAMITPEIARQFMDNASEFPEVLISIIGALVGGFLLIVLFHISLAVLGFVVGAAPTWFYLSDAWGENCVTITLTVIAGLIMGAGFMWAFRVLYIIISSWIGGFSAATYLTYLVSHIFGSGYIVDLPLSDTGDRNRFGCWVIFYAVIGLILFIGGLYKQFRGLIKDDKPAVETPQPAPQPVEQVQKPPKPEEPAQPLPKPDDPPKES